MYTCGECNYFSKDKCLKSGFLGCSDNDLLKISVNDPSCDDFEELD